jgi:hypothetical protein
MRPSVRNDRALLRDGGRVPVGFYVHHGELASIPGSSPEHLIHPSGRPKNLGNSDWFFFQSRMDFACLWSRKERSWNCG